MQNLHLLTNYKYDPRDGKSFTVWLFDIAEAFDWTILNRLTLQKTLADPFEKKKIH